jgi:hypothetical protein
VTRNGLWIGSSKPNSYSMCPNRLTSVITGTAASARSTIKPCRRVMLMVPEQHLAVIILCNGNGVVRDKTQEKAMRADEFQDGIADSYLQQ